MRISPESLAKLDSQCKAVLEAHNIDPKRVDTLAMAWEVFHQAKGYWLYDEGLNDSHIDTALKHIFTLREALS